MDKHLKYPWLYGDVTLLLLYCGLIYGLSDQSTLPAPTIFLHQDKLIHAVAYALMAWLAWRAILHTDRSVLFVLGTLLFCSLYGISDEWHQSFVPGRQADVWDWIADTMGAGMALCLIQLKRIKQR